MAGVLSSQSVPASGIQGLLLKLHELLSDEDSRSAALKCHDIIGDLGQECMLTTTENELGKRGGHIAKWRQTPFRELQLELIHA